MTALKYAIGYTPRRFLTRCEIQIFNQKNVVLERLRGSFGLLTLKSEDLSSLSSRDVVDLSTEIDSLQKIPEVASNVEEIQIRQYDGRIREGVYAGEKVIVKMYPKTEECDILAANELRMHEELQPPKTEIECPYLMYLIGGYLTNQAQCLVFKSKGSMTLAQYCGMASEAFERGTAVGSGDIWDILDPQRTLKRRKKVFIKIFQDTSSALQFMHDNFKLHQSLGPESITLSDFSEGDCSELKVQISDLALGVDISDSSFGISETLGELWDDANEQKDFRNSVVSSTELWTRARMSGAWSETDKRNFGIADDISIMGFLFLYSILSAFSKKGSIDGLNLYRLVQTTFDSDIYQFSDYCREDETLSTAVEFLDMEEKAGWELIAAMTNKDWKSRPTANSCLNHRFLNGALFLDEA